MTVTIGRRELLVALGGAAAAWPLGGKKSNKIFGVPQPRWRLPLWAKRASRDHFVHTLSRAEEGRMFRFGRMASPNPRAGSPLYGRANRDRPDRPLS